MLHPMKLSRYTIRYGYPLLDRDSIKRPPGIAGQGPGKNGTSEYDFSLEYVMPVFASILLNNL